MLAQQPLLCFMGVAIGVTESSGLGRLFPRNEIFITFLGNKSNSTYIWPCLSVGVKVGR